jgi:hypothetical protein
VEELQLLLMKNDATKQMLKVTKKIDFRKFLTWYLEIFKQMPN